MTPTGQQTLHQVLPPNKTGRDFLLGDLHGCVDALEDAMATAGFDSAHDRIISVGDLIDRGPRSHDALRLTRENWFHAVRGNHEAMMLDADDRTTRQLWQQNGGDWFFKLDQSEQAVCIAMGEALPVALTLQHASGATLGICHAEWPGEDWSEIEDMLSVPWMRQQMMWGRTVLLKRKTDTDASAALTIHGHTPLMRPVRLGTALFIDTGCVHGNTLTLMPIEDALQHAPLGPDSVPLY